MGIEEDTLRELKQLNQNLSGFMRQAGSMARTSARNDGSDLDPDKRARNGSRASESQKKAASTYDSAAKKFFKVSGNLTKNMADSSGDFKTLRESFKEGAEAMFDMKERVDKWGDGVGAMTSQAVRIAAGMSRFQSSIAKTTKAQSLLYSEQLKQIHNFKDFEKAAYFDELSKSLGALTKTAKERLKLIDSETGMLKADLGVADFQRIRSTLGEVEASIKETLKGTGFQSLADLAKAGAFSEKMGTGAASGNDKSSVNKEAVAKIAAVLQSRGLFSPSKAHLNVLDENGNMKGAAGLNKIDWEELTKQISLLEMSFEKTNKSLDKNVDIFQDKWSRFVKSISNAEGKAVALDTVKKMTADFLSSGAAFKTAKDKIINAFEEISSFNVQQIPTTYTDVMTASVKLGMSFKDTTKLLDDNKRILAIYGPEKFTSAMGTMSKTFQKYGYTMEQAAEMVGPTVESAITAGIDIRDPAKLNEFTDKMMGSFQQISGIVKVSAAEFASLNKNLFESDGAYGIMLGLEQQKRTQFAADLVQQRSSYILKGLELQQAQELVKAQQEQQRGKLGDRTQDAAKAMALAQAAGMGGSASMEIFNLSRKGRRSSGEQSRLTELLGQLNQATESSTNAGYGASGSGAMGDIMNELRLDLGPQGQLGAMGKAGSQMVLAGQSGSTVSSAEQARAAGLAQGNSSVAAVGNAVNSVSAVLNNSFLGALGSSSLALVAFTYQLSKASMLLSAGGGLGGLGGIGGMGGKLGKLGGLGGKLLKGGGLVGLLGAGIGIGGDYLKSGAADGSAAQGISIGASVLGSAASGAGTGALIGSIIPGVGTVVGGAIGGAIGTGYGLYQNWGDMGKFGGKPTAGMPSSPLTPSIMTDSAGSPISSGINTPATVGGTSTAPGILGVQDKDAAEQLRIIAQQMASAVDYLQKMTQMQPISASANRNNQTQLGAMTPIPSAYEFTTGRVGRI